jgi:hypothetical protein
MLFSNSGLESWGKARKKLVEKLVEELVDSSWKRERKRCQYGL